MSGKIIWGLFALSAFVFVYIGLKTMLYHAMPSGIASVTYKNLDEIRGIIFLGFGVTWLAIASIGMKINLKGG
jgi:hypothetical protein